MTPLMGASLERLGYDAAYTLRPSGAPTAGPALGGHPGLERNLDHHHRSGSAGHRGSRQGPAGGPAGVRPGGRRCGRPSWWTPAATCWSAARVPSGWGSNILTTQPRPSAWWHWAAGHCALPRPTAGPGVTDFTMSLTATTGQPVRTAVATWALADTAAGGRCPGHRPLFRPRRRARGVVRRFLADGFFRRQRRLFRRIRRDTVRMSPVETPSAGPAPTLPGGWTPCWPVHHVPAHPAGPGGPGGVQPGAGRAGWLTFGIPEMLAHLALCLGLTYASNRALAALFRVRPHSESSLITGLLLYFLFWPRSSAMDVAGVALACVLASASKYALAWRGRHIFNPAAAEPS